MNRVFVYEVRTKTDKGTQFHSYIFYDTAANELYCISSINQRAARRRCREKLESYTDNYIVVWRDYPIDLLADEITNTRLVDEIRRREIIK